MTGYWLILETSGRVGKVGLAQGGKVVRAVRLNDQRRHARDLAVTVSDLLNAVGARPTSLSGIVVGRGPGSYTGLRVGLMSAKALAYALDCELRPVETFAAIAEGAPGEVQQLWVIADALQGQVYAQPYSRESEVWRPLDELRIQPAEVWTSRVRPGEWVSGPGVSQFERLVPAFASLAPEAQREAEIESVFRVGMRIAPVTRQELFTLEPLYLRGSSAEEKQKEKDESRR